MIPPKYAERGTWHELGARVTEDGTNFAVHGGGEKPAFLAAANVDQ